MPVANEPADSAEAFMGAVMGFQGPWRLLESSPAAAAVGKTYTSPQPAFDSVRMVLREHLVAAGSPIVDMMLTSAS